LFLINVADLRQAKEMEDRIAEEKALQMRRQYLVGVVDLDRFRGSLDSEPTAIPSPSPGATPSSAPPASPAFSVGLDSTSIRNST
jgi:hypothetical protein